MSSITWTPSALRSERRALAGRVWRVVEAQHRASTLRLTASHAEQALLEDLLEATKPAYPPGCERLDYLLKTPFRYAAPRPFGSRFRAAADPDGVFYAAESKRTAFAETAFYRLLFFAAARGARQPSRPVQHTIFAIAYRTHAGLDLEAAPLARDAALWRRLDDYRPCQALGVAARAAAVEAIRYRAVRDRAGGANVALLTPAAFAQRAPSRREAWLSALKPVEVYCYAASGTEQYVFPRADFMADPRLAALAEPADLARS